MTQREALAFFSRKVNRAVLTVAIAAASKTSLVSNAWILKRVQDDGRKQRGCTHPFSSP
ncbi:hypothetical protein PL2TA16_02875 [Pseudoalteromonas luteoviolacea 2ta16]|uniref:Uncharacterized protein n=1 Tax=Pseudoalteromonas luteoviolacea (strain 2ta16) TaxID=1353533 RepID=V4HSN0_PSEL2|nr:hypothetical protein PL2TA16_02875 [Pseudoalteromonas luteoviolacea 2ta16]